MKPVAKYNFHLFLIFKFQNIYFILENKIKAAKRTGKKKSEIKGKKKKRVPFFRYWGHLGNLHLVRIQIFSNFSTQESDPSNVTK